MVHQLKYVVGVMFVVILVYSGLWYTAAFEAEKQTAATFANWRDKGLLVEHGKITHGGFPYRITVTVEDLDFSTRAGGLALAVQELTLVSHLWTPQHWIAEAKGVKGSAAKEATQFADGFLHASYKMHEGGRIVIVVNSRTLEDFALSSLLGQDAPKLKDWELAFMLDPTKSEAESGLYGGRFLNFKVSGRTEERQLEFAGGISGPVVKDWNSKELANWRDEGGLIEFDTIDFMAPGGRVKGNASLTLDERFRPLGSASLIRSGSADLKPLMAGLGFEKIRVTAENGPASVMLQNGRLSVNGTQAATLPSVIND